MTSDQRSMPGRSDFVMLANKRSSLTYKIPQSKGYKCHINVLTFHIKHVKVLLFYLFVFGLKSSVILWLTEYVESHLTTVIHLI
jgi:hypothetical protein